jgi:polar amino acid transport system substrate-binding protein
MKKIIIALLVILTITSTTTFASGNKEQAANGKETIKIATNAEWPPLEFVDDNGDVVGYEVELVQHFADVTDYNWEIVNVAWDGIFAGMANGAYDGLATGVSVTEERKQSMDFCTPFLYMIQSIIVPSDSTISPENIDDLVGLKVGVLIGAVGDLILQDSGLDITIKSYDNIAYSIEDMLNGNLDAVVVDSLIAGEYVVSNKAYQGKLVESGFAQEEGEPIAMCFPKGDTEHVELVNQALLDLEANGTMAELKAKYGIL